MRIVPQAIGLCLAVFLTRGVFLFLLVYGVNKAMPRLPAGFRHALWFAVICSFLFLPAARLLLPAITLEGARAFGAQSAASFLLPPLAFRQALETALAGAGPAPGAPPAAGALDGASLAASAVYLCGVAFCLLRQLSARKMLRELALSARVPMGYERLMKRITLQLRINRRVSLMVHERIAVPFTYGFLKPRVLLPASSRSWPAVRLSAVLAHELSHVRRGDSLFNLAAFWMCALLWFLPPAWFAWRFMREQSEISCDLSVLDLGFKKTEYASTILDLGAVRGNGLIVATHSFFGDKSLIRERIQRILRRDPPAGSGTRGRSREVIATALVLALTLFLVTGSMKVTERLYGSWTNVGFSGPARYAWSDNGVGREFAKSYSSGDVGIGLQFSSSMRDIPCSQGPFTIEKEWSDQRGNEWYEVKTRWSSLGVPRYALIRLDPAGNSYESDESLTGYPAAFTGPLGAGMHLLFVRQ